MSENAVAVVDKPRELSVVEVKAQVVKVQELMKDLMQEGTHYGESFPGDTKKNLLKPGADKLCFMFRLRPDYTREIKELPGGHMEVITCCQIFHIESGMKIAEGIGLASTMESKYRWRNAARKCPTCGKETIIKGKEEYGGGYICYGKKGGCGAKFGDNDPLITDQVVGKIENPDIADTYNTVIKMSKKRAYVDATIAACAASDIFSQDAEDFGSVAESLAHEASQEAPRNVTPPPESPHSPPKTERQIVIDGIAATLKTLKPDTLEFFTDEEKNKVKADIAKTKDIVALKKLAADWENELKKRQKEYVSIPFGDEPGAIKNTPENQNTSAPAGETPTVPASEKTETQEQAATTEAPAVQTGETQPPTAADDGFQDDIPWKGDGNKPGKTGKPKSLKEEFQKVVQENAKANAAEAGTADAGASDELDIF